MTDFSIQPLTAANKNLLHRVEEGVFDNEVIDEQLEAFIQCPRHTMQLALVDGVVVGMLSAVEYLHPDKLPQLWINEVAVAPSFQNQGIGRALVDAALEQAQVSGWVSAWLGTDVDNNAGQNCFNAVNSPAGTSRFILYEWSIDKHE